MELAIANYRKGFNNDKSMASLKNRNYMLRDPGKNKYPYFESDTPKMLDKLLENGLIELPESKRPEEIEKN